jgi:hypothetical protein
MQYLNPKKRIIPKINFINILAMLTGDAVKIRQSSVVDK